MERGPNSGVIVFHGASKAPAVRRAGVRVSAPGRGGFEGAVFNLPVPGPFPASASLPGSGLAGLRGLIAVDRRERRPGCPPHTGTDWMENRQAPDGKRSRQSWFFSWPVAVAFWAAVSVVGWVVIAGLVMELGSGDGDQIAAPEQNQEMLEVQPAAGPEQKK